MTAPLKAARTPLPLQARLAVMVFFQYFVQGAYWPVATLYLKDHLHFAPWQLGAFGAAVAVGALLAPFLSGQFADRYMATERFLALSHLLGGVIMLLIARQTEPWIVLILATLYSILYVPTISLSNTLCFRHLADVPAEFPRLRMWGTIGFMLAQWPFEYFRLAPLHDQPELLSAARADAFLISGIAGIGLAIYCLTLPSTPPDRQASKRFAPGQAIGMLRQPTFLILFLVSLPIAMVHKYHFVWNAPFLKAAGIDDDWIGRVSSVGQAGEIAVIAVLGWIVARLGFKYTLAIGILGYVLRNAIFALDPPLFLLVSAQALHGVCFACFFATAFMLVDRLAPADARNSVQAFFNIFALGVGAFLGGLLASAMGTYFTQEGVQQYAGIWWAAFGLSALTLVLFLALFPNEPDASRGREQDEPQPTDHAAAQSETRDR